MTTYNTIAQFRATHFRLKSRITERVYQDYTEAYKGAGIIYCVKVQVKILRAWITLWAESCDFSDGDARFYIKSCAEEVKQSLTENI